MPLLPIPETAATHAILLLREPPLEAGDAVDAWVDRARSRRPGLARTGLWSEAAGVAFGRLEDGRERRWHALIDNQGAPAELEDVLRELSGGDEELGAAIDAHRGMVMLFLLGGPEDEPMDDPLGAVRALAELAWTWLDRAILVAFPEGGTLWVVDEELRTFEPSQLAPEHWTLFTSYGPVAETDAGLWLATVGLGQAGLPEMACVVPSLDDEDAVDGASTLFASMGPYLLEIGRPLELMETLELEHRFWEVTTLPEGAPERLAGASYYARCDEARVDELARRRGA